jgi:hypothetical protein
MGLFARTDTARPREEIPVSLRPSLSALCDGRFLAIDTIDTVDTGGNNKPRRNRRRRPVRGKPRNHHAFLHRQDEDV